jgi:hypothetical protein
MSGFAAVTPSGIGDGSLRIIQTTENRILGLKGIILAAYASVIDSALDPFLTRLIHPWQCLFIGRLLHASETSKTTQASRRPIFH